MKVLLLLVSLWASCQGARILAIFPSTFTSHVHVYTALTKQLARQGHQVTVLSPFPQKWAPPGYVDIDLMMSPLGAVKNKLANEGPHLFSTDWKQFYQTSLLLWRIGFEVTEAVIESQQMKDLIQNKEGFDLVITEYFLHEALHGLAQHFKVPLVLFAPTNLIPTDSSPISFVPHPLLLVDSPMNFVDRMANAFANLFWTLGYNYYYMPKQEELNKKLFGDDAPSVWSYEPAVILMNSDPSFDDPKPLQPSTVEVGGLHIHATPREVPAELQEFMDSADDGLIYFSFGESLQCESMPPYLKNAFIDAFSHLEQKVIWKYENDTLPGISDNVKLFKWLPQQEILEHRNTRLMITHGGSVSGQEAAHFGIPVVAIPVFGEQLLRAERTHRDEFGVKLEIRNVTRESLLWAMDEAMNNPRIKQATEQRALELRDQAQPPLDRAVFWVEYALRHGSAARRLRTASRHLSCWQRHSLDVVGVLVATLLLLPLSMRMLRGAQR